MKMSELIKDSLSIINIDRLKEYVKAIEGLRHGWQNHDALEKKADFIAETLDSFHLHMENQSFDFHGRAYRNIIGTLNGSNTKKDWLLLGAHYDAAWGSPGADDNASGVAVLLEAAFIISKLKLPHPIQFVAFTLEEPQPQTIHFLIGSDFFAKNAKKEQKRYKAVFILESVGYTDDAKGSQVVPLFVRVPVPKIGNFLGIVANRRSKGIMESFHRTSGEYVPELLTVKYKAPLSGRIIPETRFSDHASFWDQGYPALMLTDTAMFRNPHYHTHHDRFETLDFTFIQNVTKAVVSTMLNIMEDEN